MSFADAQAFLHDQIPTRHQVLIPPVLQAAYAAVKMVMASDPMLGVPSALDNRGPIRFLGRGLWHRETHPVRALAS